VRQVGPIKYLRFIRDKKKIPNLIVYAVGIREITSTWSGFKLLLDAMLRTAVRFGHPGDDVDVSTNALAVKASERLGMKPDKHFAIFEKALT